MTQHPHFWPSWLATTLLQEHDYAPVIEGVLPAGLNGTLYRNGPGCFQRGAIRKNNLLDGDGMIQAFTFSTDGVRYRNRFVQTPKFRQEQQANAFLYPTWSTRAPGGPLKNVGNQIKCQAGVTVVLHHEKLYAFDEVGFPFTLDPVSLDTLGEQAVGAPHAHAHYKAHTKTDPRDGSWMLLGVEHGKTAYIHLAEHGPDGSLLRSQGHALPRFSYFHDWFATEGYAVVALQPLMISLPRFLLGLSSFIDSLRWQPEQGNLIMVFDREGVRPPLLLEAPACFMWHSLNAFEAGDTIVADFVGYEAPDHFIGENAALRTVMQGREGIHAHPGLVRRYTIDLVRKKVEETHLYPENHEFPMVDPAMALKRHRYGYFTTAPQPDVFHTGLVRIDFETGERQAFFMGDSTHLGEPIFVPAPGAPADEGWLLTVGLDGKRGTSFLAIFEAAHLDDGPIARVLLQHPTPLSFHGWWHSHP